MTCITAKRLSFAAATALALGSVSTPSVASAQMRALLPTIDEVEPLEALPIDGVWEIREIRERIVIESGHGYAEDGWVHMLLFRIEPEQVVLKNIRELADGGFVADDLPQLANVTFEWVDDDTLQGRTNGLIPVTYHLDRVAEFESDFETGPSPEDDIPLIEEPPTDDDEDPVDPW
ncbi:MAG: hypothetical protein QNJ15_03765 [Erythrobacter sp.]|nr:hypothetical protein [Erythrobacter sp.]